jgi:O-antigen/teichoic acid export membrane protein
MRLDEFMQAFFKRKGHDVFISSVLEKVARLLIVVWITHILSKEEVGLIVYAQTSLAFIIPFLGFGIQQGLIRYGALSDSQSEKKTLFKITLRKGLLFSSLLMLILMLASPLISRKLPGAQVYLILLSFQFISLFTLETVKIYARLLNLNRLYARISIVSSLSLLLAVLLFSSIKGAMGYAVALAFTPFPVSLYYIRKFNIQNTPVRSGLFELKKFLHYGLMTSLGNVLSQLLFAVDIMLIGNILSDSEELIAQYKVSNIIPFSLLILGMVFIRAEYVRLTYMSKKDRGYLMRYYRNYFKVFLFFGLGMLVFSISFQRKY